MSYKIVLILFMFITIHYSATDTVVLQQGVDGYAGCIDVSCKNALADGLCTWKINPNGKHIIANYRC